MKQWCRNLAVAASLAVMSTQAVAQQTLIYGEAAPNRGSRAAANTWLIEQIKNEAGVDIQEQWGGALFKASGSLTSIGNRVADFGTIISAYFPTEMTAHSIADLPLGYSDPWVMMRATDELMRTEKVAEHLRDLGLVYIGSNTTTAVDIGCKGVTVKSLQDLDGLKVRVAGVYGRAFSDKYGVIPVNESIYKAYQGLDSGLYDCTMGYAYIGIALKWQEQFTSYTRLNWGQFGGLGLFMNADAWDELGPEKQAIVAKYGAQLADHFGESVLRDTEAAYDTMKEAGIEVLEVTDADKTELLTAAQPYIGEWLERANASGLDGQALLDEFQGLLEKYETERQEQGYPWER